MKKHAAKVPCTEPDMRLVLLVLGASVLPFLWGWFTCWLLQRLWPEPESPPAAHDEVPAPSFIDYQI